MKNTPVRNSNYRLPWWLYLLFAICCYGIFRYLVPTFMSNRADNSTLSGLFEQVAPISAIIFLLLAANALYDGSAKPDNEDHQEEENGDGNIQ